jgi:tRNA dimethylallyltransferase
MTTGSAYFLVGATASGKSTVAQVLAEQKGWSVLSSDSMLIYTGMDIGTAKPSPEERARVPYGGVDLARPDEDFSVWAYRQAALEYCQASWKNGRDVIVTGGSGLYVKALTHGIQDTPGTSEDRRMHWQSILDEGGVGALQKALESLQPGMLETMADPQNPRRLMRALSVAEDASGEKVSPSWQGVESSAPLMGLEWPPEVLAKRIAHRVRQMFVEGLVDEARALRSQGSLSRTAEQAIGYAEAFRLLDGEIDEEEAVERIALRTRRLAKKQRTWFRHQSTIDWVRPRDDESVESIAERVLQGWRDHGPTRIVT